MLKQQLNSELEQTDGQPPSGGCVLKQSRNATERICSRPAAFRRLCVETGSPKQMEIQDRFQPPSGGCVLKQDYVVDLSNETKASRLQAAVC